MERIKIDFFKHNVNSHNISDTNKVCKITDVLNRGTVKLCEIDSKFDLLCDKKILRFVDICSAPGGFIDYILIRKKYSAEGYGISLPVSDGGIVYALRREPYFSIHLCYANILDYCDKKTATSDFFKKVPKVDLILADGADVSTSIQNTRNLYKLLVTEIVLIKKCCKKNGRALLKLFDITTNDELMESLIDLLQHFEYFHFYKPPHSRATNAERYLILKNFSYKKYNHTRNYKLLLYFVDYYFIVKQIKAYEEKKSSVSEYISSSEYFEKLDLPLKNLEDYFNAD